MKLTPRSRPWRRLTFTAGAMVSLWVALPGVTTATTGGPEVAEMLGWDPARGEVYFYLHALGDVDAGPCVGFFALESADPCVPKYPQWSAEGCEDDSTCAANLARLRRRLRPLEETNSPSIPYTRPPADRETLRDTAGPGIRFTVHLAGLRYVWQGRGDVVTYRDSTVRVLRTYSVPGRSERIFILSFIGIPYEEGYEAQVPVLIGGEKAAFPRVEWKPRD